MSQRKYVLAFATVICMAFVLGSRAYADSTIIDVSAGSNWRTTTDGLLANQWAFGNFNDTDGVAATAPYGNTSTTTLNENRMMWSCGADGMTSCTFDGSGNALGTGPNVAYFGLSFEVPQGSGVTNGAIALIADDFYRLYINGEEVSAELLADHVDMAGQPVPVILDFATLSPYFRIGTNVIAIGAEDFSGFEYLFVSGSLQVQVIEPYEVDISAGPNWRTTTDVLLANQWNLGNFSNTDGVAATSPYGNIFTTTLNEDNMMWNCGADGTTLCTFDGSGNALGTGPNIAYFGYSFDINPAAGVAGGFFEIIADDFFRLFINGEQVEEALLSDNLDLDGQPQPVSLDLLALQPFFQDGTNVITIGVEDFFGSEYLYVRGAIDVAVVDLDGDGIVNTNDNCIVHANTNQRDTDNDGFGNVCDPDLNNDGDVNFADIALWVPFYNTPSSGDADFDGDSFVSFADYAVFAEFFLQPPGPSAFVAP